MDQLTTLTEKSKYTSRRRNRSGLCMVKTQAHPSEQMCPLAGTPMGEWAVSGTSVGGVSVPPYPFCSKPRTSL